MKSLVLREFWASTLFSFPHQTTVASHFHATIPVASHTFGNRVHWAFALQCVATITTGSIASLEQIRCSLLDIYGLAWNHLSIADISLASKKPINKEALFRVVFDWVIPNLLQI